MHIFRSGKGRMKVETSPCKGIVRTFGGVGVGVIAVMDVTFAMVGLEHVDSNVL
jgi:hypothetical protein